jgi:hypothetical protein
MSLAGFVGVTLFTNMAAGACDCKEEPANPNPRDHEVKPHIVLSFLSFFPAMIIFEQYYSGATHGQFS